MGGFCRWSILAMVLLMVPPFTLLAGARGSGWHRWIIIIGGAYGDLVESLLKRSIEIKDSGDSLPGSWRIPRPVRWLFNFGSIQLLPFWKFLKSIVEPGILR